MYIPQKGDFFRIKWWFNNDYGPTLYCYKVLGDRIECVDSEEPNRFMVSLYVGDILFFRHIDLSTETISVELISNIYRNIYAKY